MLLTLCHYKINRWTLSQPSHGHIMCIIEIFCAGTTCCGWSLWCWGTFLWLWHPLFFRWTVKFLMLFARRSQAIEYAYRSFTWANLVDSSSQADLWLQRFAMYFTWCFLKLIYLTIVADVSRTQLSFLCSCSANRNTSTHHIWRLMFNCLYPPGHALRKIIACCVI